MQLTINVPWLTPMRRVGIGLSVVLVLVAVALPASAAQPDGIDGEVLVVNPPDQPLPIVGEVTADVTGSVDVAGGVTVENEATDPVPVSGSVRAAVSGEVAVTGTVNAAQSGDWTVRLDSASAGHLSGIDASTSELSYDESGNLNVNVAAGDITTQPQLSGGLGNATGALVGPSGTLRVSLGNATVTAFAINASESVEVMFMHSSGVPFAVRVLAGDTLALALPYPFEADELQIRNRSDVDDAFIWYSVSGY